MAHLMAEGLDRAKPAVGNRVVGEEVGLTEEAKEEGHDGIDDLLGEAGINVDDVEVKFSGEGRVNGLVGGAEVEDELPRAEVVLGGAGEEGKGVHKDGGSDHRPPWVEIMGSLGGMDKRGENPILNKVEVKICHFHFFSRNNESSGKKKEKW